ncbi:MAG: hypothetical protein Q9181_000847 [Wetmoreana brouardii]
MMPGSGSQDFLAFVDRLIRFSEDDFAQVHEHLLAGEKYLCNPDIDVTNPVNHAAAVQLRDWTINVIQPTDAFALEAPFAAESKPIASQDEITWRVLIKTAGVFLLSQLRRLQLSDPEHTGPLIACLASFTNAEDPWTSDDAHGLSRLMLSEYLESIEGKPKALEDLITNLLRERVKPLFVKSRNPILTEAGRKASSPTIGNSSSTDFESADKPWKFETPHIVAVFEWILQQLDASLVQAHWPLVIPPLLTTLDDVSIKYKIRGCKLLQILVRVAPANLLERSGLGEVFHNTLTPYLLYLPSLTPEEESIPLLDSTYDALISLTRARYPNPDTGTQKIKTLDAIFRYGILKGYAHAGENVRIAELFMQKSADLVGAMKIYCVKHLKDLLPIISGILTAPFALAYPPLLVASLQTLRAVVVNAWPRVGFHTGEILEGLLMCWCRIADEEEPATGLEEIQASIKEIVRAVVQLLKDDEAEKELKMLNDCDARLEAIFTI